jgi:metal-responsive CopG/Arc/MetJ family transcriptional regulator
MKDPLVRFGVAVEGSLLRELDALARKRGCTRSELLRDLGRAEVGRAKVPDGVDAVGALTLVYDHHTRDLSEKLTALNARKAVLAHRAALLDPRRVDPDLADELVRRDLGVARPDELVVPLN